MDLYNTYFSGFVQNSVNGHYKTLTFPDNKMNNFPAITVLAGPLSSHHRWCHMSIGT